MSENLIGATTAVFPIRLSIAVTSPVDVEWATRDGSAVAGVDYKAAAGVVTFEPGETEKQIEVQVYGQAITPADDKLFFIRLNPPSNAVLVDAILTCTINIIDDQGIPSVAVVVAEGRRGPKGDPGLSAYQQAVVMGYTGSPQEWMDQIADASKAADRAQDYSNTAANSATAAVAAAQRASLLGNVYQTPSDGVNPITGVKDGMFFNVRSPTSEYYIDEYQNVGGVPTPTGKSYPSAPVPHNLIPNRDVSGAHPASAIQDASGKSQQYFNFANYTTLTLEAFGGKTYEEDPEFDNADVIYEMFRSVYILYDTQSGMTSHQIRVAINTSKPALLVLNGLYRTTRHFHIPPNVAVWQCFNGYFVQDPKAGIFYDPVELNTYAVAPFLYRRDTEVDDYHIDTDVMSLPTGFDFDSGVCIMAGVRQQLINLHVITKRGVTLAFRNVGWAGCYAENVGCGENNGVGSRNPKVAMVIASAWGSRINGINTLSTHTGFVPYNANGGLVVSGMYSNQAANISDYVSDNSLIEPIFKTANTTVKGSVGVMQLGEVHLIAPICEGWHHPHYAEDARVSIVEPHYERVSGYNFFLVNSEAVINLKGVTGVEALALFYLKDYRDYGREVKVTGLLSMGGRLVDGENSDPSLVLDVQRPHSFIQYYSWGDLDLIKSVGNDWGADQIYVDPVNGDDTAVGLRDIRAFSTLVPAVKLSKLFRLPVINIMGDMAVPSGTVLPNEVEFIGAKLQLDGYFSIPTGKFDVSFYNSQVNSTTAGPLLLFQDGVSTGNLNITADINAPQATLVQALGSVDVNVHLRNTTTNLNIIGYSQPFNPSSIAWNAHSTNYNVTYNLDGGMYFSSVGFGVGHGSLDVAAGTVPANGTLEFEVPVKAARFSYPLSAAFSGYVAGLSYSASVKSSGLVNVVVKNNTGLPVALPAGTVYTKMV